MVIPQFHFLEILQTFKRPLYKPVLGHIQVRIDFHGSSDTGVTDGLGEGSKIEVGIVLMLDVVVGHVGMTKAVNSYIMSQTDLFTDFPMPLAGTAADATAERKVRGSADILVLPADRIVFLFDDTLDRLLFRACIVQFCLS